MNIGEDALARGRPAFDAADWRTAYDILTGVDQTSPLAAADLDRAAEAGDAGPRAPGVHRPRDPVTTGPTATSDVLAGTRWLIRRIDRTDVLRGEGGPMVLSFGHDGRASGATGVKQLTASYNATPAYLTFGPMATTRRAAPPELMMQEHRVVGSLAGMCPYRLSEADRYGVPATLTDSGEAVGFDA